ncbi:glycosyltransferase family 2 protein [Actinotalea sp. Marseille-Q4924]|uniref:glycosyltransferase family 2 protein n=1 Tax=Actinotalea sp. Marseille-Q4924 TaxID=2866571 RepID=UPI001CE3C19B|nr:glycosyltransferase family 2 protein [Actinotalea sp. Marseille-Q4924]
MNDETVGPARAPEANRDAWLVVPLYNEATVIRDVVSQARATFPNVVCVDDGSGDRSAAEAAAAGAVVVSHPINLGQGAAIQTGLTYALAQPGAEYFVTFDSDGQHQVEDALAMVERLRAGEADVIFGSRFLDARTRPGAIKRVVLRLAVLFSNLTSGVRLTDAHNGLRAFNRTAAASLRIRQNRMAHASEIVEQVGRARLSYAEHPVHILYTDYSRSKGQSVLNSVNILTEMMYR